LPQSYTSHAHRPWASTSAFLLALAALALLGADLAAGVTLLGASGTQWALLATVFAVFVLVSISRLYIVRLQDRIIRLEMRLRLRELLPASRHADIARLSTSQLVALRFASDAELPALVDRALREQLTRDQIKRAVTDWQADNERT
jgi:hypothetical protein